MKTTIPSFYMLLLIITLFTRCITISALSLNSPDKKTQFSLQIINGLASYSVTFEDSVLLQNSPLGLERTDESFAHDLILVSQKDTTINNEYQLLTGKQLNFKTIANQTDYLLKNRNGEFVTIEVRAYNEGMAFRYCFNKNDTTKFVIYDEKTGFKLPLSGKSWIMPYDTISMYTPAYETFYTNGVAIGTVSPNKEGWSFPALFQVKNKWLLITESGLNETYCASHLQSNPADGLYQIRFPEKSETFGLFSEFASNTLPWATPWRVIILGNSCGSIVESSLATHVAEPSRINDKKWIKPGKSSWSWWSDHDSPRNFESLKKFVDFSSEMGWEYSLVDANWDLMTGGNVKQLIDYANSKHIGIWLWYNSGGKNNDVTERPRDMMFDPIKRKREFQKLKNWGVKGIKIDFFQSDKQEIIKLYMDILRDAAEQHIMINFHGCTLPRGWQRTYPNLMSMEAVRGAENYGFDPNYPAKAVWHNTIYPFTRNVIGSMDYTPVTFSNQKYAHLTSDAYELAMAIVFESGILNFADKVDAYNKLDEGCKNLLKNMPTTWDETKHIAGEPGKYVVIARRKADKWYVGGINGQIIPQRVELDVESLKLTNLITENPKLQSHLIKSESNKLSVVMNKYGGFVAY